MKFDDDFEEESGAGLPVIYMALAVSIFVLAVMSVVVVMNNKNKPSKQPSTAFITNEVAAEEPEVTTGGLRAEDLDIWDMYPVNGYKESDYEDEDNNKVTPTPTPEVTPEIEYNDGEHIRIDLADGSSEWMTINKKLPLNNYDFTNMVDSGGQLKYITDGKKISFLGIDVSKYQKEIDYSQIKDQGIEFVMVRVGQRGYKSGELSLDEYYETNVTKANEVGLDVGLYFMSQAISVQEAEEEAQMVLNAIGENKIKYPIAFDMEPVENDKARIDTLDKNERYIIADAFCKKIKEAGYKTLVYGNKEWLLKKNDISRLTDMSIWLAQDDKIPDYPYMYEMWQYTTNGNLFGIDGSVDMNICFVDYTAQ